MIPSLDEFVEKSFDDRVVEFLREESFGPLDSEAVRYDRAVRYALCGKEFVGVRCADCFADLGKTVPRFVYPKLCGLKGCRRCSRTFKMRLLNRFLPLIRKFKRSMLRFCTFTYHWVDGIGKTASELLKWVNELARSFKFRGVLASVDVKERVGGMWFVHVHAIVVGSRFKYGAMLDKWEELSGCRSGTKFKEIWSSYGAMSYMMKYVTKDWLADVGDARKYVDVMKELYRKKLFRAFGCFYGRRKRASGKPNGGGLGSGGGDEGAEHSLVEQSVTNSSSWVCPSCGGSRLEWFSCSISALASLERASG